MTSAGWSDDHAYIVVRETGTAIIPDTKREEEGMGSYAGTTYGYGAQIASMHKSDGTVKFDETIDISSWDGIHFLTIYSVPYGDHE